MSTPAKAFGIYFGIGLLLMSVALISGKARKASKTLDPFVDGGPFDAGMLIFIALLWPVWLLAAATRDDNPPRG